MSIQEKKKSAVIALGMFDGVHIGHRALMRATVELAQSLSVTPVVYSFLNHPLSTKNKAPTVLTTNDEKETLITELGLQTEFKQFDKAFASMTPTEFFELLRSEYDLKGVVAGYNYHFGHNASGDHEVLRRLGENCGIPVRIIAPVKYGGYEVSSTRIRACLRSGHMREANEMLGAPYSFFGCVTPNRRIGSSIGFPTANILPGIKAVPKYGVYASELITDGYTFPSVTNIGLRPTVEKEAAVLIETHMLSNTIELYGHNIAVRIFDFIRPERRFESLDALKAQIKDDCYAANTIHNRIYGVYK